jgi:hypothetical protein
MVQPGRLRIQVEPGRFASERTAIFFASSGKRYSLFVDEPYVEGDTLLVEVLQREGDQVLIRLPQDLLSGHREFFVPREAVT